MSSVFVNKMTNILLLLVLAVATANSQCLDSFTSHPQSVEATLGQQVSFSCDIEPDQFLHRTFRHYLPDGSVFDISSNSDSGVTERGFRRDVVGGFANTLTITGVRAEHTGYYACFAQSDTCLTQIMTSNATLTIGGPPSISSYDNQKDFPGDTASNLTIPLLITGTDPDTSVYRIEGGNENVITDNHPRIRFSLIGSNFELTINDLQRVDGGEYKIYATNNHGSDDRMITVSPVGPDRPVVDRMSAVVSEFTVPVSVTCEIQDNAEDPSVTFSWTNDMSRPVTQSSAFAIASTASSSTLTVNTFTRNFTGGYTCKATNVRGSDSKTVFLYGPPPSITSAPVITGSGRQRTISWSRPTTSINEPILSYRVTLYRSGTTEQVQSMEVNVTQDHPTASATFSNIDPGNYDVRVAPVSVAGDNSVRGAESPIGTFIVDGEDTVRVIAIAVGAVAGVAVLVAIGAAIGIFFLCFYYPHKRQLQSQQQTWSREDVKTDGGAVQNEYSSLTLRPNSDYPSSPGMSSPTSSSFLVDIDPKWEFPRENVKLLEPLCDGQFTTLYRGVATGIQEKPVDITVKAIKEDFTEEDVKALSAEMEMLSSIGPHENIVSMIRVCTVGKPMYMVMEYMCHGDLLGFLRASRGHHGRYYVSPGSGYQPPAINLYPRDLLNIGAKIASGMRYLADRKLVHRALCAKNVLVGSNMSIKIYNVGSFDMAFETRDYIKKWLAPETLFDQTATTYSDVWSFGVTLWELVTVGGTPYGEIQSDELYSQLVNGMRMPCPQHCAEEIHELMLDCWRRNPVDRPHFSVIHEKLEDLATSKMSLLDFQNYDVYVYSQFEEPVALSTVL